ncbi:glucokinase [Hansschlegelia zhihuaiae]|uniref:glucokinase n=1 Tax=Hansschlegelia zhihuaiae TaxID=405005 RepID=UPI0013E8E1E1|nr:glucokinase [Hansschlegelia zhihuaiae]
MTLLVADIGGTHGRFGLLEGDGLRPGGVGIEEGDAHATFEDAVAAYLGKAGARPDRAVFAVAGPVDGGRARITNRPNWTIDAGSLRRRFGFAQVTLLNDFAAQALCLPHLEPDETRRIGGARPRAGVKAAVGPGTGLGVAALLPEGNGWRALAGEGGHVEFAAVTPREAAAFEVIRKARGRVSAEDVLSGPGLARLHDAFAAIDGETEPGLQPGEVVASAGSGGARAAATVDAFLDMLARFCGDVALTFGAWGGVHLCGGVAPRLLDRLDAARFRSCFEAKPPHGERLSAVATLVVLSPIAGLIGCAAAAQATDDPGSSRGSK